MKNKTPKPRVMWAIYDNCADPIVGGNRSLIRICEKNCRVKAVRVAVISLDDTEAIVERAAKACGFGFENTRIALTAAGIPCLKRKARK
jgi:hypothetical protein